MASLLDRAIEKVSPEWALRRRSARDMLSVYSDLMPTASHRGGLKTRTNEDWKKSTSYLYGQGKNRQSLAKIRDRSRKFDQDNPIYRSILNTETDNVVGAGYTLQARTGNNDFNEESEDRWREWLDKADITGMSDGIGVQRMPFRNATRDGDIGLVLVDRGGPRLQMVPGDLIQTPDGQHGKQNMVSGVELDGFGRPIRYHVLETTERGRRKFTTVNANNFVFITRRTDAYQVRGESAGSQVFDLLERLDRYVDAVVIAARMAAIFGLIFKEASAAKQFGNLPTLTNTKGDQQKALTLENNLVKYVGNQDDIVQVQAQQPMNQTPDFIASILRIIGLPFDMPLEIILKDMSKVTFISGRLGLGGYYRAKDIQARQYIKHWDRIYQWWISKEVKAGRFTTQAPDRFWGHEFIRRPGPLADPISEYKALLLAMDMGIESPQRIADSLGVDYESVQKQLEEAGWKSDGVRSTMSRDPKPSKAKTETSGDGQDTND